MKYDNLPETQHSSTALNAVEPLGKLLNQSMREYRGPTELLEALDIIRAALRNLALIQKPVFMSELKYKFRQQSELEFIKRKLIEEDGIDKDRIVILFAADNMLPHVHFTSIVDFPKDPIKTVVEVSFAKR